MRISMNTASSGSGRIDDLQSHPQGRVSLGRRNCVKITEDVRKYAASKASRKSEALESGMQEKRKEFVEKGAELYAKA